MADDMGEKTELPTPRRRQEARDEGNIARSTDLMAGALLLGAMLLLGAFATHLFSSLHTLVQTMLAPGALARRLRPEDLGQATAFALKTGAQAVAPIVLALMGLALIVGSIQAGFLVSPKGLMPKFSRVSPIKGLTQLFSMRSAMRLVMSLAKVALILTTAFLCIHIDLPKLMALMGLSAGALLAAAAGLIWALSVKLALLLLILGIIDYLYQRWQHEQDMRMTKHQVKEEFKRMEGDPLTRQRRARVARELAMQRLAHDVPKADVVVTNPTHFAIALKYDAATMAAPKVVAKGADYLALRIRQIAAASSIPIVERPPLARALYKHVEVGREVPAEHYAAVAEILAYVYRLAGRKSA